MDTRSRMLGLHEGKGRKTLVDALGPHPQERRPQHAEGLLARGRLPTVYCGFDFQVSE